MQLPQSWPLHAGPARSFGPLPPCFGSGRAPMLAAAVVAVVCAVAFLVFSSMASDMGEGTMMPLLFAAASIAAAVCAFVGRRA